MSVYVHRAQGFDDATVGAIESVLARCLLVRGTDDYQQVLEDAVLQLTMVVKRKKYERKHPSWGFICMAQRPEAAVLPPCRGFVDVVLNNERHVWLFCVYSSSPRGILVAVAWRRC